MNTELKIRNAVYDSDYRIRIEFTDGTHNTFDYKSMVTSGHEEFKQYLDITKFKKFQIVDNGYSIAWKNNWEMILKFEDLYSRKSIPKPVRILKDNNPIELIKYMMKLRDIKPIRLAEMVGVDKGYISSILNFKKGLSKSVIRSLSDKLGIPQQDLNVPYALKINKP